MSMHIDTLVQILDKELKTSLFHDYAPNGLQVEGKKDICRLVSGVTACSALIDQAIEKNADVLLVHHGYFWKGESPCITGMKYTRIKKLINHHINLVAYHLPLDAHPTMGNNAELARILQLDITENLEQNTERSIGYVGKTTHPISLEDFGKQLTKSLLHTPLLIPGSDRLIKRIAWCSGGAQDYIHQAHALGADAYLSGEISERTVHEAREMGIHYIAAGHHATERYGVQALGLWLQKKYGLHHQFIDIPNPV